MLFLVICADGKWKGIITSFNLIIFCCLTTVYNIRFFKYFPLPCLLLCRSWSLFKICYLKRFISFFNKTKCSLIHPSTWLSRKIYYYIMRVYTEEYSWRLILHMLYWLHSFVYTGRKFTKTNTFDFSFLLFSYFCRGELIEINLSLNYFASTRI